MSKKNAPDLYHLDADAMREKLDTSGLKPLLPPRTINMRGPFLWTDTTEYEATEHRSAA